MRHAGYQAESLGQKHAVRCRKAQAGRSKQSS
jgi:hypothetical protein